MLIRVANLDDLPLVKGLADALTDALGWSPRGAFAEAISRGFVLVAMEGDTLLGFCEFHCRRDALATIHKIATDPKQRGRGIGRALVQATLRHCEERGVDSLRLLCPEGLPANEFYRALGFKNMGYRKGKRRRLLIWKKIIRRVGFDKGERE